MMKINNHEEDILIDEYYGELDRINLSQKDSQTFLNKMDKSLNKMNLLNEMDFESNINIMELVIKGQAIRDKKRNIKELLSFLSICILCLTLVICFAFIFNPTILIYIEVLFSVLLPFIVIPAAIKANIKENLK